MKEKAEQEKILREKMAAGLSREMALQVMADQEADDLIREEREEAAAAAKKAAPKPPKGGTPSAEGQTPSGADAPK